MVVSKSSLNVNTMGKTLATSHLIASKKMKFFSSPFSVKKIAATNLILVGVIQNISSQEMNTFSPSAKKISRFITLNWETWSLKSSESTLHKEQLKDLLITLRYMVSMAKIIQLRKIMTSKARIYGKMDKDSF